MLVSREFVPPGGGSPFPPLPIGLATPGASGLVADAAHIHAIQVVTTAQRNALTTGAGRPIFNSDTLRLEYDNGSGLWVSSGIEVVTTVQRNLLVAFAGRTIYNTNTNHLEFYNGTTWQAAGGSSFTYRELSARYVTTLSNTGLEAAGAQTWNPTEHDLTGGRRVFFRAELASSGAFAVRVKLFNRTANAYVQNFDGASNDFLTMTGAVPQQVVSDNLISPAHTNFNQASAEPFEVQIQSMSAGAQAILGWAQFIVST